MGIHRESEYTGSVTNVLSRLIKHKLKISQFDLSFAEVGAYFLLTLLALALRLFHLGSRAMHHDESLHAFYSWQLSEGMGLIHNPMMHGPLQMEITAGIFFLLGDSDFNARVFYAVIGTVLVVMPILFRSYLGKFGAIFTSSMLCISPAMLYFSRFARNDIIMAVFTFGLVITLWNYLATKNNKYLYIMSALLALCFGTKETAFLVTGLLGLYLVIRFLHETWKQTIEDTKLDFTTYPQLYVRLVKKATSSGKGISKSTIPAYLSALILLSMLTLPQWSAFAGILQNSPLLSWSNLTLVGTTGNIGMPVGGGKVIASVIVAGLLGVSFYVGFKWCWSVWWRCAVIFYSLWILIYTTVLTNLGDGIRSGIWQSLGYWVVQQGEARGAQPIHYYLMITPLYEYLPFLVAIIASIYYLRIRERFSLFLVYWSIATFVVYTMASEKMPWLLVNISLPIIVLSGRFLGRIIECIKWNSISRTGMIITLLTPGLIATLVWAVIEYWGNIGEPASTAIPLALILLAGSGFYLTVKLSLKETYRPHVILLLIGSVALLTALTLRTSVTASYVNSDIPVEMIVYTQTSPDLKTIMTGIKEMGDRTGDGRRLPIKIDQTSGFTWPWSWYLRHYENVGYPTYNSESNTGDPTAKVILVHSKNHEAAAKAYSRDYLEPKRIPHRWWFPEYTYRNVSIVSVLGSLTDFGAWKRLASYWLNREGVAKNIGSEDSYLYAREGFPQLKLLSEDVRSGP